MNLSSSYTVKLVNIDGTWTVKDIQDYNNSFKSIVQWIQTQKRATSRIHWRIKLAAEFWFLCLGGLKWLCWCYFFEIDLVDSSFLCLLDYWLWVWFRLSHVCCRGRLSLFFVFPSDFKTFWEKSLDKQKKTLLEMHILNAFHSLKAKNKKKEELPEWEFKQVMEVTCFEG